MKKIIGMLIVLAMLMSIATVAGAFGFGEVNELQIGENVAEYAPVYYEEYGEYVISPVMYMWTIPEDGTLTIDFSNDDEATVMCFIVYNNAEGYQIMEKGGSVTFDVVEGATLTMEVYNEEAHIYEAATFHFTVSLGEATPGMAGTGAENDPWIIDTMPATLTGTITDANVADEEWAGYFYKFTATESGIVSWGPWSGCGLFVTLNDEWLDADYAEVVEGDEVVINVWALFGAGTYTVEVAFEGASVESVEHTFDSLVDVNIGSTEDKAEIPAGTTFADGYFTVVGKMTQRYQESKGGIYAVEIAKNGTGALEFTTAGTADVVFVVSSTGGSNVSAVALINVNTLEVMTNVEGLSEVSTTAATTLTYVGLPAGTYQLVSPESDYNRGFRLMTVSVVETAAEEAPACTHEGMYLEYDFCYEDEGLYDLYEYCPDCGYIGRRYAPGTEKNPLLLDAYLEWNDSYSEAVVNVTVGAGETVWYGINRVSGMILNINGEEIGLMESADFWSPCTFELVNDGDADVTFEIKLTWPLGSDYNPDEMVINGSMELYLPENSYEYVYQWFATEDGVLTITLDGKNWNFCLNNWGDPDAWDDDIYGDRFYDCYGDPNTVTMQVKAGDQLVLYVGAMDADWNFPEETFVITTTFVAGTGDAECEHWNSEYEYDDEGNMFEVCPDCGEIIATYLIGSYDNPIMVDFLWNDDYTAASAVVTVPAGQSLWFGQYRIGGLILTINGEDMGVLEDMGWYYPTMFCITNDGTEDATYELVLTYPLGSYENPIVLEELGQFEVVLELYNNGLYYKWVATADGVLTLTIEGNNWTYFVNNETAGTWGDRFYGVDGEPNTYSVEVKAGDVLLIGFGTLDENWMSPAETLVVTLELATEEGPCKHENLVHVDAVAPGCYTEGNIEHWYCEACETVWADEALTMITNHLSVILPATHQHIVHVDAKAPSCYEEGNVEYWYCEDCVTVWVDEALLQISNMKNVVLPATHQHVVHVDAVAPGCYNEGNVEYWYCEDCVTVWVDEALLQISNMKNVVLPATHQHIVHVEAVAPSCTEHGNVEYWYCEDCVTVWIDEALLQISNMKNVVDPAIGHNYVDGICANCGENDQSVPDTGDMIAVACALVVVSGMAVIALPKKKEN